VAKLQAIEALRPCDDALNLVAMPMPKTRRILKFFVEGWKHNEVLTRKPSTVRAAARTLPAMDEMPTYGHQHKECSGMYFCAGATLEVRPLW